MVKNEQSCLEYKGIVNLYLKLGDKRIKMKTCNAGLPALSDLFTRACLGYSLTDKIPVKVDLQYCETEGSDASDWKSILNVASDLTGRRREKTSDDWYYVVYDALILGYNVIKSTEQIAGHKKRLILMNGDDEELAEVILYRCAEGEEEVVLGGDNNVLIEWEMHLVNSTGTSSSVKKLPDNEEEQ